MRKRTWILAVVVAGLGSLGARAGDILNIGDPAPPLKVAKWVKGEKVEGFEPGQTYVVEFWATWCGPCRASIPHLTELAHKYKDQGVRFVGVDVWERDLAKVEPFLAEMGDRMDYNIALDDIPAGGEANDGAMAKTWMRAAEENGIPAAFVVRDGKLAWIGHPMKMDEPLARIVAGDYQPGTKVAERLAEKTKERNVTVAQGKIYPPYRAKDYKATLAAINEVTTSDPDLVPDFASVKFACLCNSGEVEPGLKLGEELFEKNRDKAFVLNNTFFYVVSPDLTNAPDPRVARLAVRALQRAVDLEEAKDYATLDSLAEAQYRAGDPAAALATEEKALKCLEAQVPNHAHPYDKKFTSSIDRFRRAAEAKAAKP